MRLRWLGGSYSRVKENNFRKEDAVEELTAWQRWRMCDRKKPYFSRRKANKAARKRDMYVYECPICFAFHITKTRQEQSRSNLKSTHLDD
jgi:hypothetical protein